jgi:endonuclease YncB( thermonuclease family)
MRHYAGLLCATLRASLSLAVLAALMPTGAAAQTADLTGVPVVSDGDTLDIRATRVRLEGIDAPETDQICLSANGDVWTCGIDARDQLAAHIAGREISCTPSGIDRYKRTLGKCRLAGEDLNAWMVEQGWALAYVKYSSLYVHAEQDARSHLGGLWRGAFIAPWDWRHRNEKTVILGAFSVPLDAQKKLLPPRCDEGAPSPECNIKGNVSHNGERIYHMPDQQFYCKIKMNGKGKRWFCTPEEAEAAGWRRALRR